jgi:hypothetical protein
MIRVLSLLLLFGIGAQALGGGTFGVVVSGAIALAANHAWKKQDRQQRLAAHAEEVERDEALRLHVREQRTKP